ncbi:hypothetical protein Tco_0973411 [Tanacetum coccineum]
MHTSRGDGVASIKRRRHNPSGDGVRKMMTASGCGRLKRGSRIIYMAMASVISAKNQEIVQGDRVNIQSRNSGNDGRNTRHSYVQEEIIEGNNVQNDAINIQITLLTTSSGTAANVQCYNRSEKSHYVRNCPKPRNDFLFANASRMEEIKELSANICLIARIQPTNFDSDAGPSYDFEFLSELNALYEDFVPQKEFSAEQKYFSSSFISSENPSNASSSSSPSETKSTMDKVEKIQRDSIEIQEGGEALMKNRYQELSRMRENIDEEAVLSSERYGWATQIGRKKPAKGLRSQMCSQMFAD